MAAAALVALLAVAAGGTGEASGSAQTEPLAAVQAVLDARAEAVRAGDAGAWLATVDPAAPRAFRDAQARQFEGLRSLDLADFSLRAETADTGDLGAAVGGRYGGAPVFLPRTRQTYRLGGYDDRDAVDELWLTFVQRNDRWYVGGDTDLEGLGMETDRQLWDFGPVTLQRGEHVLVLSHPQQAARAQALAAMAEEAVAAFTSVWDQEWSGRVPLVLPGSVDELERLMESTVDLDKFVAFAYYAVQRDEGWTTTAPRVYIQDVRLSRYDRAKQVETLVHELVHVAAAQLAGPFVPAWVHEGVADWAATGRRAGERRPAGGDSRLPRDFEMSTGSQASIVRAYGESRAAMSLLAARRGNGAPTSFFKELGSARVAAGSLDHNVDDALRRSSGLTLGELERAWATR